MQVPISEQPLSFWLLAAGVILLAYWFLARDLPYSGFPVISVPLSGWQAVLPAKFSWILRGKEVLAKGLAETNGPFQVMTGSGYKIILPNRFAHELRTHPDLSFKDAFTKDLFVWYPGFDGPRQGLRDETFIQEVVRIKLTQSLGLVTADLVEETIDSLHDNLGEHTDWQTLQIKQNVLDIVARLSARVFLGKDLCRNKEWLDISKAYTGDIFKASEFLRLCPGLLRPILFWCIPTCRRLVGEVRAARRIIMPEVEQRVKRAQEAISRGDKPPKTADTIGWMVEIAEKVEGRKVDYVAGQLSLSSAAIHTTSETMSKCLVQLCNTPEIGQLLREEAVSVLQEFGWSKTSFYKMTLMDSFLKEVQRTNGLTNTSMNRAVKAPITLSDGTRLPAGARIMVSDDRTHDEKVYTRPAEFDIARYRTMRQQPGAENTNQFVTVSTDNMAFGYGQHACPGRFFASNELKIALAVLLLKYDVRHVPGKMPAKDFEFENVVISNPALEMQVRRRTAEVDLDGLTAKVD